MLTPVNKVIPRLAVPTIISMMTSMIYNLVDAFFVGKINTSASAAIGILLSVHALYQAIGFMHGHSSGSIISAKLGQGDKKGASRYASIAFFSAMLISCAVMLICFIFRHRLMVLLGSTETILPYAEAYGIYIILSGPALSMSCVLNNIMRYEGKAFYAMIGLVSGGVLNMILDPVMMFSMDMGIAGAGLATAISQCVSLIVLLVMFMRGHVISRISPRIFWAEYNGRDHLRIIQNGLPSLLRQMLLSFSSMTLNICANPYGDAAIAAMTIVGRIMMFTGSAMIGIGQGFQPVAAYNSGAGKFRRIRAGYFFTWKLGELVMGALTLICLIFPAEIITIFRDDPEVVEIGVTALRFRCVSSVLQPFIVVTNMTFQSMRMARQASFLACLRSGLYYIPALLILPHFWGITGIESAQMVADILTVLTVIPFAVKFLRELPKEDQASPVDSAYEEYVDRQRKLS